MKQLFLLLMFTITMAFTVTVVAQPIVYSGKYTTTLAAAGTTYIYPLTANGDTITTGQLGVMSTVTTVDSTGGNGNGTIVLQYSETLANDDWYDIATETITVSATGSDRTVTAPYGSRRVRAKCTQAGTGATAYSLNLCYMNYPW